MRLRFIGIMCAATLCALMLTGCSSNIPGAKAITPDQMVTLVMEEGVPIAHLYEREDAPVAQEVPSPTAQAVARAELPDDESTSLCIIAHDGTFYLVDDTRAFDDWVKGQEG